MKKSFLIALLILVVALTACVPAPAADGSVVQEEFEVPLCGWVEVLADSDNPDANIGIVDVEVYRIHLDGCGLKDLVCTALDDQNGTYGQCYTVDELDLFE